MVIIIPSVGFSVLYHTISMLEHFTFLMPLLSMLLNTCTGYDEDFASDHCIRIEKDNSINRAIVPHFGDV